jgi:hypothetical protein
MPRLLWGGRCKGPHPLWPPCRDHRPLALAAVDPQGPLSPPPNASSGTRCCSRVVPPAAPGHPGHLTPSLAVQRTLLVLVPGRAARLLRLGSPQRHLAPVPQDEVTRGGPPSLDPERRTCMPWTTQCTAARPQQLCSTSSQQLTLLQCICHSHWQVGFKLVGWETRSPDSGLSESRPGPGGRFKTCPSCHPGPGRFDITASASHGGVGASLGRCHFSLKHAIALRLTARVTELSLAAIVVAAPS